MAEIGYIGENTDLILGQEFLTWLWFRSETGNVFRMEGAEHSGEPFTVAMEQRIVVRGGEGENQETATVVGSFSPLREARLGLLTGKQVVRCLVRLEKDGMNYAMSILKSAEGDDSSCERFTYAYSNPKAGMAKFIHTYNCDGNPLPSFEGEPKTLELPDMDIDSLTDLIWTNLNSDNKVSLFVRYIDLESGKYDINKTALMMSQTGGGCRASNYVSLLRKALEKAGRHDLINGKNPLLPPQRNSRRSQGKR